MIESNTIRYTDALTVKERVALYKKHGFCSYDYTQLQSWIQTKGVVTEADTYKMMELTGISSAEFNLGLKALSEVEQAELAEETKQADWAVSYEAILAEWAESLSADRRMKIEAAAQSLDLGMSLSPFLLHINRSLETVAGALTHTRFSAAALLCMVEKCSAVLISLSVKTLVWEMHCFATAQGKQSTESKNEKFLQFIKQQFLSEAGMRTFYAKYPVIARRLTVKCQQLLTHFTELMTRFDRDFSAICTALRLDASDNEVVSIDCDAGDIHQQGRFVVKLTLRHAKLVYKPKDLRMTQAFYELIRFFNQESTLLDLHLPRAYHTESYTFEAFISHQSCQNREQITRYYRRFGQLCAIIYMLAGNDIHYENIIAHGEYPVIVDMETLFQQLTSLWNLPSSAFYTGYKACLDSVTGTSLIPSLFSDTKQAGGGIDISALNGTEQTLPFQVMVVKDANTDRMRFSYGESQMRAASNIPQLNQENAPFAPYIPHILSGFRSCMLFILGSKRALIGENGILKSFCGKRTRQLLKSTHNYVRLMEFSSHPNYGGSMPKLERMFHNAWNYNYRDKRVIEYEINDMLFGDIPIFYAETDSRDLLTSTGIRIKNYFTHSGYDHVVKRIETLSCREIEKQIAHLELSFGLFRQQCETRIASNIPPVSQAYALLGQDRPLLLHKAEEIADILLDTMLTDESSGTVNWNNILFDDSTQSWQVRPLDQGLSHGLSGILLFFLALDNIQHRPIYEEAIQKLLVSLDTMPPVNSSFGTHTGIASYVYILLLLSGTEPQRNDAARIFQLAGLIESNLDKITAPGFIDGNAGLAKLMLETYALLGDAIYLSIAERAIGAIRRTVTMENCNELDVGFGHGLAGILYVMREYSQLTESRETDAYCDALQAALIRKLPALDDCSWEWGLTGILSAISDELPENLRADGMRKIVLQPISADSLAAGKCGPLSLLVPYRNSCRAIQINALASELIAKRNYSLYTHSGFPTAGLFYGLSGVGCTLLSLYSNTGLPDALTLSLPVSVCTTNANTQQMAM